MARVVPLGMTVVGKLTRTLLPLGLTCGVMAVPFATMLALLTRFPGGITKLTVCSVRLPNFGAIWSVCLPDDLVCWNVPQVFEAVNRDL